MKLWGVSLARAPTRTIVLPVTCAVLEGCPSRLHLVALDHFAAYRVGYSVGAGQDCHYAIVSVSKTVPILHVVVLGARTWSPIASQPRTSSVSSSSFGTSHCPSSSAGTKRLSKFSKFIDAGGGWLSDCACVCACVCVLRAEVPVRGRIDRLREGGGGICLPSMARLLERGWDGRLPLDCIGAGVCLANNSCGREESGASSPGSPVVIRVYSDLKPSRSYASCIGRDGRVYRTVMIAPAVSAWAITALKSFRLMARWMPSWARKCWKSFLSIATEVCTGCLRTSTDCQPV